MASGIYQIRCVSTGRVYVGSAVDLARRISHHRSNLRRGIHHSAALQRAWAKYGDDDFRFEVLEPVPDPDQLLAREQEWIDRLKAYGRGFNCRPLAASSLGYRHTPEDRAKISAAKTGKTHIGVPKSPETRAKISATKRAQGRKMPPEMLARLVAFNTDRKRPPETGRRISAAKKGRSNGKEGIPHSAETRAKMSAAMKRFYATRKAAHS